MATLETLRRTVGRKSGMDYGTAGTDRDLIDSWCNEGVREVLLRTHCFTSVTTITTAADDWQYELAAATMAIKQIWRDGETSPMIRVTPEEIIEFRRANAGTNVSSLRWALEGANLLLLWPTPSSIYTIDVIHVPKPTEMTATTHDPSSATYGGIPVEYHKAIELWALANASDHEHEGRTQQGLNYLSQFESYIRTILRSVNRKGGSPARARIGRRPIVSFDNDTYPR